LPEDIGEACAHSLLQEVMEGGCVDSTQQSFTLMMMALGPEDVTRIRLGKLTQSAMGTMRLLRDFLGVVFKVLLLLYFTFL
jgi:RNA 3'-terminal phosphate cyclase-like protein